MYKIQPLEQPPETLAATLLALSTAKREEEAIALVIERADDWMLEGHFEWVDEMLQELQVEKLAPTVIVAVLSAVQPGRKHLQNAVLFTARAKNALSQQLNDEERVSRLMLAWK